MQEAGRLFCSKCGNAALQKVEVIIGTDGTEQYGVRKKHIIRGTKFPLPKPHVRPTPGTHRLLCTCQHLSKLLYLCCSCSHAPSV